MFHRQNYKLILSQNVISVFKTFLFLKNYYITLQLTKNMINHDYGEIYEDGNERQFRLA